MLWRPFEIEFGPLQKQLLEISDAIREETSLASMRAQKQEFRLQTWERKLAKEYRLSTKQFQDKLIHEQREARLRAIRKLITIFCDMSTNR